MRRRQMYRSKPGSLFFVPTCTFAASINFMSSSRNDSKLEVDMAARVEGDQG